MKRLAALSAAALIGLGALNPSAAEARGRGGAVAAGVIGGLAAGALLGSALSEARAAPAYGYGDPDGYRPVARGYVEEPVYASPRYAPPRYAPRHWERDCDRDGYGGW